MGNNISKSLLVEKLIQYPDLLHKFKLIVDTQGTTLDDIQQIIKLANESKNISDKANEKSSLAISKAQSVIDKDENVNTLINKINDENARANTEETSIQDSINTESSDRVSSDDNIQVGIETEINERVNGDDSLQKEIDKKQDKLSYSGDVLIKDNVIEMVGHQGNLLYSHKIKLYSYEFIVISTYAEKYTSINELINNPDIISIYYRVSRTMYFRYFYEYINCDLIAEKNSKGDVIYYYYDIKYKKKTQIIMESDTIKTL